MAACNFQLIFCSKDIAKDILVSGPLNNTANCLNNTSGVSRISIRIGTNDFFWIEGYSSKGYFSLCSQEYFPSGRLDNLIIRRLRDKKCYN